MSDGPVITHAPQWKNNGELLQKCLPKSNDTRHHDMYDMGHWPIFGQKLKRYTTNSWDIYQWCHLDHFGFFLPHIGNAMKTLNGGP